MRRPTLEILIQEDVQKIIEAANDLLEKFGVKIHNQEALEILAEHTLNRFRAELFFPTEIIARKGIREGEKASTAWERAKALPLTCR